MYIDHFETEGTRGYYRTNEFRSGARVLLPGIRKEICSANILEVTACTNGYCGGDSGHGSRTVVIFRDKGGTDIQVVPIRDDYENVGVEIRLGGDCELCSIIDAFRFAADSLERLALEQPID